MQGAQDLQRLIGHRHRRVQERRLESADVARRIARRAVPGGRHHGLIVGDLALLDDHPVTERAARGLGGTDTFGQLRPGSRLPFLGIGGRAVAGLEIGHQLVLEMAQLVRRPGRLQPARRRAPERREQRRDRELQVGQHLLDRLLELRDALGIADDVARQRPDLHRVAAPARGLDPTVFGALVDGLDPGLAALGVRTQDEVRLGHAVPGMQSLGLVFVLEPGMGDELLDLLGIAQIDLVDLVELAVDDGAARQALVVGRIVVGALGDVAIGQHRLTAQAPAVGPILIEGRDGHEIGQIDLVDELDGAVDDRGDQIQPLHVDRAHRARVMDVDGAGHAADQPVRMRVLAAVDGVDLDDLFLEVERLQIVGDGQQIGLGRQPIGRIAPVAVGEGTELTGLDEALDPGLHVAEIAGRGQRPVRDRLRQFGGRLGIGLERRDHVHPVQRMQMIEVHQMVVRVERQLHDVADGVGVLRDPDVERVLDGAHRGQGVRAGAHTADALGEGPGVARIATAQDHLQTAPHGAGRDGVADDVVRVEIDLAAHVTLDAGHGVDDDTPPGGVELEAVGGLNAHACSSSVC